MSWQRSDVMTAFVVGVSKCSIGSKASIPSSVNAKTLFFKTETVRVVGATFTEA